MQDKIDSIKIKNDGTVVHNILRVTKKTKGKHTLGEFRTWPSLSSFKSWRTRHMRAREEAVKERLTPIQFFVTQGMGHERPFTGDYWWTKDVGTYSCVTCTQKVFMSHQSKEGALLRLSSGWAGYSAAESTVKHPQSLLILQNQHLGKMVLFYPMFLRPLGGIE